MKHISRSLVALSFLLIAGVSIAFGWRLVAADARLSAYEREYRALAADHETLRSRYNDAVRETAITE
ncbi:MAG: hypothetical protein AAGH64_03770, partial [Planctomycetota bacterium]